MSGYRCIVADPPWPQKGGGPLCGRMGFGDATGSSKAMPYALMSVNGIAALPIRDLAHPDGAHLYLWTTNGFLDDAFDVIRAWGFRYSTTLVWAKAPMGGGLGGAYGISTEYCLYARRPRSGWDLWGDQAPNPIDLPILSALPADSCSPTGA